jgi:hypothetical protein
MINWDKEGGGDLTKFLRANKAKREEKIRKINIMHLRLIIYVEFYGQRT